MSRWDRLGMVASAACVVHCLLTPVLLLLMPVLGAWWSHPAAHWGLAVLVLPLAGWVVYRGYQKHRRRSAMIAMTLGVVFIVLGLVLPEMSAADSWRLSLPAPAAAEAAPSDHPVLAPFVEGSSPGAAETGCTDSTCCPSVAYDASAGETRLTLPAGTLATLAGSVFLVLAHAINLHGCRCWSQAVADPPGDSCGCA